MPLKWTKSRPVSFARSTNQGSPRAVEVLPVAGDALVLSPLQPASSSAASRAHANRLVILEWSVQEKGPVPKDRPPPGLGVKARALNPRPRLDQKFTVTLNRANRG